mmetsp:Transcript_34292/g.69307  ORF Transcript_34292/g.69307 Transcript_34292/m.69307 type:complete len:362 (-) Transcript_34292:1147-2232(-)
MGARAPPGAPKSHSIAADLGAADLIPFERKADFNAPEDLSLDMDSQSAPRRSGAANLASIRRSATSSSLDFSIISCIAFTCPLTASSFSACVGATTSMPSASAPPSKDNKSLGIWYLMKSCMRSCVNLISFVRLSAGNLSTFSSWGLIWMTKMPNKVLSNCIARNALANACCSGDNDSMASLNSLGVGMVDKSRGMVSSSLFCTMAAYFGSKVVADAMRPTRTSIELNCLARDTNDSFEPLWPENWCDNQACKYLSPWKQTLVEALMGNCIGCGEALWATNVTMGAAMLESPPGPLTSCSMLTVPSGACTSERRTAKQNGVGMYSSAKSLRLWNRIYSAKSAGGTSLPMAAINCFRSKPSM